MRKNSFNRGMTKLMKRGYSKQSAYNTMTGLEKRNKLRYQKSSRNLSSIRFSSSWIRYLSALIIQLILFFYKVPSKDDIQIMLIQTILPLWDATKPLVGFVSFIALLMQIASIWLIFDLIKKLYYSIRNIFV